MIRWINFPENGLAIRQVSAQFVELCRQLGLFSRAIAAVDGSRFKAHDRNKPRRRASQSVFKRPRPFSVLRCDIRDWRFMR